MFVRTAAGAIVGIDAVTVAVEVNVTAAGQLGLFLVGLPDNAVKESEQRIRSAFENTGLRMTGKKLVVNLAPADLRKEGAGFDLPIAVGILAATEQVSPESLAGTMLAGELSLDGTLKPVRGVLPMAVKARKEGLQRLIVPRDNACEAAVVEGLEVIGAASLGEVVAFLRGDTSIPPATAAMTDFSEEAGRYAEDCRKNLFFKNIANSLSLSPLGHSDSFASCKAWCVLISASLPKTPSPREGAECGAAALTLLGATPKARTLWLLAKSFARCKTNRASNAKHPFSKII